MLNCDELYSEAKSRDLGAQEGVLHAMSSMIGFSTARRCVTALNRIYPNFRSRVNSNTTRSPGYLTRTFLETTRRQPHRTRVGEPSRRPSAPAPIRSTAGINFVLVLVYVQASQFVKIYRMAENRRKKKDKGNNGRPRSRSRAGTVSRSVRVGGGEYGCTTQRVDRRSSVIRASARGGRVRSVEYGRWDVRYDIWPGRRRRPRACHAAAFAGKTRGAARRPCARAQAAGPRGSPAARTARRTHSGGS